MEIARRLICYLLGMIALLFAYLLEGGHLDILYQPAVASGFLLGIPIFLTAKHGVRRTVKGLFGSGEVTDAFVRDAMFVTACLGAMMFVGGLMLTMGKLSQGGEVIGYSIAVATLTLVYAFVILIYFSLIKSTRDKTKSEKVRF